MIHVLSKILGRKKSGNNESSPNGPNTPSPKNQTIWQKATSLRQSLRQSSRSKVGQKSGFEFSNISSCEKSATLEGSNYGNKGQENSLRREWKSQRNLARERRSLATKTSTSDELAASKRSLHSRSLCMSGDWDVDNGVTVTIPDEQQPEPVGPKPLRSPRKLTKDSGYETSAQGDHDYANSISDWFSQEKALDEIPDGRSWSQDNHMRNSKNNMNGDKRLEWNTRNRPLSFSHQEVASERARSRQLRHSYSQKEVSRPSRQPSVDSLSNSSKDIKQLTASVESVNTWSNCPTITKSTPHLAQGRFQRLSTSSTGSLLQSEPDEAGGNNMVTRRFKKGSVYDALASTSGLDFSPVVQLKTYNKRDDTGSTQGPKPSDKLWESSAIFQRKSPSKDNDVVFYKEKPKQDSSDALLDSLHTPVSSIMPHHQGNKSSHSFPANSKAEGNDTAKCIAAHEKYPSEPFTGHTSSSVSFRCHSWTGQTDYPKEKIVYSRPKKANQFKISTNQLQPVLERAPDYQNKKNELENTHRNNSAENYNMEYRSCAAAECSAKQFDFEAFHTPCIPQCFEEKGYKIHSPPERDISSASSVSGAHEAQPGESNGFLSRYEEVLRHQAEYTVPLSSSIKHRSMDVPKGLPPGPDTPFLDRLRLDNALQMPPPPVPMIPAAIGPEPQPMQELGNFEILSDNGTWMGSMESSSHGRGLPKWQGSYSDLSTLSTELSNRSSLFDSGHSTMPESGRLSPESSCDSTAPSLLLEGPTRAQVVARHGHREIVAHSARVKQPERHGSESVLYYATGGPSRMHSDSKLGSSKKADAGVASSSQLSPEEAMYRSHASVTLSPSLSKSKLHEIPDNQNKPKKCPSRQDSRKSSNSFSSEDSYPRSRSHCGDDTSGSSSDISNITCISKGATQSKSLKEQSPVRDVAKPTSTEQSFAKYKSAYEPPKSKSMDETTRKFIFPDSDKRQRISDPDLKQIQKQAVMSFYQRMSMAESVKAEQNSPGQQTASEMEPPPPYEATPNSRINMYSSKLSLAPKKLSKQLETRTQNHISPKSHLPPSKPSDSGLNHHSKSVPNLVMLKGQHKNLDLLPSHTNPIFKRPYNGSPGVNASGNSSNEKAIKTRGSPFSKEDISDKKLSNVFEKKREVIEKRAALSSENKDPPEDNGGYSSGMHYFKSHKSPRKVQLKEVHHSNETASVKVMTPDGVTLVQTHEHRRDDKHGAAPIPPHKRRPAPPPPPKQPPKRPPPPPPPVTPPPQVVVVVNGNDTENVENKIGELMIEVKAVPSAQLSTSTSSPQLGCTPALQPPPSSCCGGECPSSPDLPLPPPPQSQGNEIVSATDEPLPPPPAEMNVQQRILDSSSLIYPKNSYMSYRSERKLGRQGFDGKYRRSFHTSASSVDLTTLGSSFQDGKDGFCPSWEQKHNIRQHGTNVIFHSDSLHPENRLQRSSSQDCVLTEESAPCETDNISKSKSQESEGNQSSISINSKCSNDQGVPSQSVPYSPASHERNALETENSLVDSHTLSNSFTKVASSESSNNGVENCDTTNDDSSSLDNSILTDESFVESDTCFTNVDHNQNAVKNSEDVSRIINGSDINRITHNSATQTTDTARLVRKYPKTKEEHECEQLSIDFVNRCGDTTLKNLLIPSSNRKTMSDYMEGLLNIQLETSGHAVQRHHIVNSTTKNENRQKEEKWINNEKNNSIFNSKMKNDHCKEMNDNQSDEESDLKKRKEELILSIEKKVDTFRNEQTNIREEMLQNELLGQEIASRLQKVAKPNELEKFSLHVEEMEKIVNLLLSLSGRLARAENILKNMPKESSEEKKILETKREKLREQHEDARRLKESIDRRNNQVSTFLHRYFTENEYADYDHFIKMKTKLIVDIREIDEKINLGEEQLAALSVVAHVWKSANS